MNFDVRVALDSIREEKLYSKWGISLVEMEPFYQHASLIQMLFFNMDFKYSYKDIVSCKWEKRKSDDLVKAVQCVHTKVFMVANSSRSNKKNNIKIPIKIQHEILDVFQDFETIVIGYFNKYSEKKLQAISDKIYELYVSAYCYDQSVEAPTIKQVLKVFSIVCNPLPCLLELTRRYLRTITPKTYSSPIASSSDESNKIKFFLGEKGKQLDQPPLHDVGKSEKGSDSPQENLPKSFSLQSLSPYVHKRVTELRRLSIPEIRGSSSIPKHF